MFGQGRESLAVQVHSDQPRLTAQRECEPEMTATIVDPCDECGADVPVLFLTPGPMICPECRRCYLCAESVDPPYTRVDDQLVCAPCHDELPHCDSCERVVLGSGELRATVSGDQVCEDCAYDLYSCARCSDLGDSDDLNQTQDGGLVCDSCRFSHYTACEYCDDLVRDGDYCDNGDCPGGRDSDYGGLVEDYGYKPRPRFHGKGRVFLGMELEINDADYSCAEIATEHLGSLGYLKEDSSLDSGFEIVTHPMTHAYAAELFPWAMLDDLNGHGAESAHAGLHVHVNRSAFDGPTHTYRWLAFIYRNEHALTALSRRRPSDLSEWATFTTRERSLAKDHAKGDLYGSRHVAVNTTNEATLELRLFASSLDRREVRAALDFVAASVEYTRHLTVPVILAGGWSWSAFAAWVGERPEYTALAAEMDARPPRDPAPAKRPAKRTARVSGRTDRAYVSRSSCGCSACRDLYGELVGA